MVWRFIYEAEDDLNKVNEDEENEEILPNEQNASEDEIDFDCDDSGSSTENSSNVNA